MKLLSSMLFIMLWFNEGNTASTTYIWEQRYYKMHQNEGRRIFQCGALKSHKECASRCPPTCLNPKPLACIRGCDPTVECICNRGYVQRDKRNTACIRLEDCPGRNVEW